MMTKWIGDEVEHWQNLLVTNHQYLPPVPQVVFLSTNFTHAFIVERCRDQFLAGREKDFDRVLFTHDIFRQYPSWSRHSFPLCDRLPASPLPYFCVVFRGWSWSFLRGGGQKLDRFSWYPASRNDEVADQNFWCFWL